MLGSRKQFAVACILAGGASAVLNEEDVNAYHSRLVMEHGDTHFVNQAMPKYSPSKEALEASEGEPHPGIKIIVDKSKMGLGPPKGPEPPLFKPKPKEEQPAPPKPKKRDPYALCKQYEDPIIFKECIQFYVD